MRDCSCVGEAVITFLDAISEKTLRSTVALTAARGRGKSAALGVAIAGAVASGTFFVKHHILSMICSSWLGFLLESIHFEQLTPPRPAGTPISS